MAKRIEYKYLAPRALVDDIRADMLPFVDIDQFSQKQKSKEYTVRSVYYDTPRFDCYSEKMEGLKTRKKFRIRGYNQPDKDSVVFLEIKQKYNHFIGKNRAPLMWNQMDQFLSRHDLDKHIISFSGNGKEKSDARSFLYHYHTKALRPAVLVIYDREAFFGKFDKSLRFTFDKNLRSTLFPSLDMLYKEEQIKYAMPKYFIFEVKFYTGLPAWVKAIIKRYELPRMALSKFGICIDSHKAPKKFAHGKSSRFSQRTRSTNHNQAEVYQNV